MDALLAYYALHPAIFLKKFQNMALIDLAKFTGVSALNPFINKDYILAELMEKVATWRLHPLCSFVKTINNLLEDTCSRL